MPGELGPALRDERRQRRPSLLAYLMVDRARETQLPGMAAALRAVGATGLELGFPFSDPIADGPILQEAADRALRNGTRWSDLLRAARAVSPHLPTAVMTYANPVFHRGLGRAVRELRANGVSGLIVPDLALEESGAWRRAADAGNIALVSLASPATDGARLRTLVNASRAFLYVVGRYGTTGSTNVATESSVGGLITQARKAAPELPILVGFGIGSRTQVERALRLGADGVVIGTAIEERIRAGEGPGSIGKFVAALLGPGQRGLERSPVA
jgi:tryptophan synthase alpha chain